MQEQLNTKGSKIAPIGSPTHKKLIYAKKSLEMQRFDYFDYFLEWRVILKRIRNVALRHQRNPF